MIAMKNIIKNLPYIRQLRLQIDQLQRELQQWRTWRPPGHFYSPIPNLAEVRAHEEKIFCNHAAELPAINLNTHRQIELLSGIRSFCAEASFPDDTTDGFRYHFKNSYFSYADGIVLYSMLRHLRPKHVIEVGSGYSSALMLDTNDKYLEGKTRFTFVEPYPASLESLLRDGDKHHITILDRSVQDIPIKLFTELEPGDILFIDSSHVSKTGSDVNYLLFEVLPALSAGVYIHFHDIFYPFEYPKSWVYEGVAWNESYALRAFLQYNHAFEIVFFVSYAMHHLKELVEEIMPQAMKSETKDISLYSDAPGGSLWLRKIA